MRFLAVFLVSFSCHIVWAQNAYNDADLRKLVAFAQNTGRLNDIVEGIEGVGKAGFSKSSLYELAGREFDLHTTMQSGANAIGGVAGIFGGPKGKILQEGIGVVSNAWSAGKEVYDYYSFRIDKQISSEEAFTRIKKVRDQNLAHFSLVTDALGHRWGINVTGKEFGIDITNNAELEAIKQKVATLKTVDEKINYLVGLNETYQAERKKINDEYNKKIELVHKLDEIDHLEKARDAKMQNVDNAAYVLRVVMGGIDPRAAQTLYGAYQNMVHISNAMNNYQVAQEKLKIYREHNDQQSISEMKDPDMQLTADIVKFAFNMFILIASGSKDSPEEMMFRQLQAIQLQLHDLQVTIYNMYSAMMKNFEETLKQLSALRVIGLAAYENTEEIKAVLNTYGVSSSLQNAENASIELDNLYRRCIGEPTSATVNCTKDIFGETVLSKARSSGNLLLRRENELNKDISILAYLSATTNPGARGFESLSYWLSTVKQVFIERSQIPELSKLFKPVLDKIGDIEVRMGNPRIWAASAALIHAYSQKWKIPVPKSTSKSLSTLGDEIGQFYGETVSSREFQKKLLTEIQLAAWEVELARIAYQNAASNGDFARMESGKHPFSNGDTLPPCAGETWSVRMNQIGDLPALASRLQDSVESKQVFQQALMARHLGLGSISLCYRLMKMHNGPGTGLTGMLYMNWERFQYYHTRVEVLFTPSSKGAALAKKRNINFKENEAEAFITLIGETQLGAWEMAPTEWNNIMRGHERFSGVYFAGPQFSGINVPPGSSPRTEIPAYEIQKLKNFETINYDEHGRQLAVGRKMLKGALYLESANRDGSLVQFEGQPLLADRYAALEGAMDRYIRVYLLYRLMERMNATYEASSPTCAMGVHPMTAGSDSIPGRQTVEPTMFIGSILTGSLQRIGMSSNELVDIALTEPNGTPACLSTMPLFYKNTMRLIRSM